MRGNFRRGRCRTERHSATNHKADIGRDLLSFRIDPIDHPEESALWATTEEGEMFSVAMCYTCANM
jgi:hypothetical protein